MEQSGMSVSPPLISVMLFNRPLISGVCGEKWGVTLSHGDICALTGSSVVMPCSFTHPPHLTVTEVYWTINASPGREITDLRNRPEYKGRVQYSAHKENNCTLTLSDVRVADTALYYARIETSTQGERWLSSSVSLRVKDFAGLVVQISGAAIEGQEVKLSCVSDCSLRQNSRIVWKKDGHVLPLTQTHNNELTLHSIRTEDEGEYSCAVEGRRDHPSPPLKISVMYTTKTSVIPSGVILEGNTVSLTCSSDANPPVETYSWYRRTGDKTTEVGSGQTHSFTLTSATAGLYHCQANNRHGYQNGSVIEVSVSGIVHNDFVSLMYAFMFSIWSCFSCVSVSLCPHRRKTRGPTAVSGDTGKDTGDDDDNYENDPQRGNPGAIQMSSVNRSHNPNTTQPDDLYQSLNPNTTQPDDLYQSLNPNTTQPDDLYQSLNPNTTQPDDLYQSLNPNTIQPDAVY
ncbi:hypothetical protein ACEWY4_017308 [Coilia grayii]|uniref:Ig-like domain-containing protein n=1 Tax=Coilia grayii TaxID=363190 RepID=A0ABD1JGQ8_9TELE